MLALQLSRNTGQAGGPPDARYLPNSLTVVQLASMTNPLTVSTSGRLRACSHAAAGLRRDRLRSSIARTPRHTSTTKSAYVANAGKRRPNLLTLCRPPAAGSKRSVQSSSTGSRHNHTQVESTMIDNNTATTTVFISSPSTLCTLTIRRIELVTTVVSVVPNVAEQPIAR
jgi:hypothetical protein